MEPVIRVYFFLLCFSLDFHFHTVSSIPKSCPSPTFRSTHTPLTDIANWPMKAMSMGYQDMLLVLELYSEFSDLNTRNPEPLFDVIFPRDALSWRCSVMNFYIQRFVCTKFDIYVSITDLGSIPISPRWYHPPCSRCLALTWFIKIYFLSKVPVLKSCNYQ